MDLSGKRVLITAAAQGIGLASVQAYLAAGAEVFAADINAAALDALDDAWTIGAEAPPSSPLILERITA